MQSATTTDRRAGYTPSSRVLTGADKRVRQLARAMRRLDSEGACTFSLLLAEGFSRHELYQYSDAARALAQSQSEIQIGDDRVEAPEKSDDELVREALDIVGGVIDVGQITSEIRGKLNWPPALLARLWPMIRTQAAGMIAKAPIPAAH